MANSSSMEAPPIEPKRLRSFARFFKSYMSISSLVIAALPIPVTTFKLIPVFQQQVGIFSVYTSMFCFLILGYIFYIRHSLARILFPEISGFVKQSSGKFVGLRINIWSNFVSILPLFFIIASFCCAYTYHICLDETMDYVRQEIIMDAPYRTGKFEISAPQPQELSLKYFNIKYLRFHNDTLSHEFFLQNFQTSGKPIECKYLLIDYLGIFLFAEAAFIIMAIKEYLQDILGLTENELIRRVKILKA